MFTRSGPPSLGLALAEAASNPREGEVIFVGWLDSRGLAKKGAWEWTGLLEDVRPTGKTCMPGGNASKYIIGGGVEDTYIKDGIMRRRASSGVPSICYLAKQYTSTGGSVIPGRHVEEAF